MFWIVTGVLILSLLLYPVAISIAHYFDNSEKDALVDSRRM